MPMTDKTLRKPADLIAAGLVDRKERSALDAVARRYSVAITPQIARLIDPGDPDDPIARQFIPDSRELDHRTMENPDPIGDHRHSPLPGIVHRYRDRVLLKIVAHCPVYCRFCFPAKWSGRGATRRSARRTWHRPSVISRNIAKSGK